MIKNNREVSMKNEKKLQDPTGYCLSWTCWLKDRLLTHDTKWCKKILDGYHVIKYFFQDKIVAQPNSDFF